MSLDAESGIILVVFVGMLLFTGALALLTPSFTRRDIFFGVSVAPDARYSPPGRRVVRGYRLVTLGLTLLDCVGFVLLFAFSGTAWLTTVWPAAALLAAIFLLFLPYVFAHRAVRRLAASDPSMGAVPPAEAAERAPAAALVPRGYGNYVPWLFEALPVLILGATVAYLIATYPQVPARYPIHFAFNGTPDSYATKSIGSYFALVWVQLGLEVLLTVIAVLSAHAKAQPDRADARFRRRTLLFLYGTKVLTLVILGFAAVGIAQAAIGNTSVATWAGGAGLVFAGLILVGALVLALTTGQGGSRLAGASPVDRTDDRYWWLGIIYHNPNDPSVMVERRFGVGWTVNVGNLRGQLIVLLFVILIAASIALPIVFAR